MGLDTWAGGCGVGAPDFRQKLNDDRVENHRNEIFQTNFLKTKLS